MNWFKGHSHQHGHTHLSPGAEGALVTWRSTLVLCHVETIG
jgi:hypothetical protein